MSGFRCGCDFWVEGRALMLTRTSANNSAVSLGIIVQNARTKSPTSYWPGLEEHSVGIGCVYNTEDGWG